MKNLVCVFAHPDDESFGPGGTIAKLSKKYNIYLLCATRGDVGQKSSKVKVKSSKLGTLRSNELREAAKILGVKEVFFLGFKDGTLSNNLYPKLADKIQYYLKKIKPEILITYEPQGVSGHIDHITISMVTMFVASKLNFVREVWQFCRPDKFLRQLHYFVYFPPGYKRSEVDKVINTKNVWKTKVEAMMCHASQTADIERILKIQQKLPKEEYFLVKKIH